MGSCLASGFAISFAANNMRTQDILKRLFPIVLLIAIIGVEGGLAYVLEISLSQRGHARRRHRIAANRAWHAIASFQNWNALCSIFLEVGGNALYAKMLCRVAWHRLGLL